MSSSPASDLRFVKSVLPLLDPEYRYGPCPSGAATSTCKWEASPDLMDEISTASTSRLFREELSWHQVRVGVLFVSNNEAIRPRRSHFGLCTAWALSILIGCGSTPKKSFCSSQSEFHISLIFWPIELRSN